MLEPTIECSAITRMKIVHQKIKRGDCIEVLTEARHLLDVAVALPTSQQLPLVREVARPSHGASVADSGGHEIVHHPR